MYLIGYRTKRKKNVDMNFIDLLPTGAITGIRLDEINESY
jgi:hypothetical protein